MRVVLDLALALCAGGLLVMSGRQAETTRQATLGVQRLTQDVAGYRATLTLLAEDAESIGSSWTTEDGTLHSVETHRQRTGDGEPEPAGAMIDRHRLVIQAMQVHLPPASSDE